MCVCSWVYLFLFWLSKEPVGDKDLAQDKLWSSTSAQGFGVGQSVMEQGLGVGQGVMEQKRCKLS